METLVVKKESLIAFAKDYLKVDLSREMGSRDYGFRFNNAFPVPKNTGIENYSNVEFLVDEYGSVTGSSLETSVKYKIEPYDSVCVMLVKV